MTSHPLALIAELTHRCPLHCVYCSNPLEMVAAKGELTTGDWLHVFAEAGQMGVLHLHLTGGEPLARADLTELIEGARSSGLYSNLITSGIGLSEPRFQRMVAAGLDHIQLSFQDSVESLGNWISGAPVHAYKVKLARMIRKHRIAFTVNLVVHRQNLDHLQEMIAFVEELAPHRMEIAHAQYYGWALQNRWALLPTKEQLDKSVAIIAATQERLQGQIRVEYVVPDYYARYPKPCMGGWGRTLMLIDPSGRALPCHAAGVIPGLQFENVREHSLEWIWKESRSFQIYRGDGWMPDPCRTCERRTQDFGGCRCQAFLLTGDPSATDPVCSLAPQRTNIDTILSETISELSTRTQGNMSSMAETLPWTYRTNT